MLVDEVPDEHEPTLADYNKLKADIEKVNRYRDRLEGRNKQLEKEVKNGNAQLQGRIENRSHRITLVDWQKKCASWKELYEANQMTVEAFTTWFGPKIRGLVKLPEAGQEGRDKGLPGPVVVDMTGITYPPEFEKKHGLSDSACKNGPRTAGGPKPPADRLRKGRFRTPSVKETNGDYGSSARLRKALKAKRA